MNSFVVEYASKDALTKASTMACYRLSRAYGLAAGSERVTGCQKGVLETVTWCSCRKIKYALHHGSVERSTVLAFERRPGYQLWM